MSAMKVMISTNPSVKSYQLVKVVSGGRAPGKSSSLASPQLLVIERFLRFGAVRLEKVQCFHCDDFCKIYLSILSRGQAANAGCCLPAACLLLARCLPAACLLLPCREFVCINLCPSKSSLCTMLRLLLTISLSMDETGCAMEILLP